MDHNQTSTFTFPGSDSPDQYCYISTEESIHSKRCFMTGEYCSKQNLIQKEKKKLYYKEEKTSPSEGNDYYSIHSSEDKEIKTDKEKRSIKAFIIMNFSDMSNIVYKWRIRSFVESLSKYFYYDENSKRLYCSSVEREGTSNTEIEVEEIQVVRADSDPSSNYVVCSRICQQMQIADLVIVDVSSQNSNVFYEFGMAVALGKLILPICYSESYYKIVNPAAFKNLSAEKQDEVEHHIGRYPWRKDLFEYYGIRYIQGTKSTQYMDFDIATNVQYGFDDLKYNRFPYHEALENQEFTIGKKIYNRLKNQYDNARPEDNTLVVYTMERFLNESQAGRCIVNFYKSITSKMQEEHCFCGERVGVLVQSNKITEQEKDSRENMDLYYNIGEIIHIGVNQATFLATEEAIKPSDFLDFPSNLSEDPDNSPAYYAYKKQELLRFIKTHIKNRGMLIYPNNPVYVNRMKNHLHEKILDLSEQETYDQNDTPKDHPFCLYHVMLKTLRYTNEIVVDISDNCLQSLFWLGAAHGLNIHAITVMHESPHTSESPENNPRIRRTVFDIAGLWTAIFHSNDTQGFYDDLAMAQRGIERRSKLITENQFFFENSIHEYLQSIKKDSNLNELKDIYTYQKEEEEDVLESYYRDCFWKNILRYNKLYIYLPEYSVTSATPSDSIREITDSIVEENTESEYPKVFTSKWDFDAISVLSHYLSRRTVIGEYRFLSQKHDYTDPQALSANFISVGQTANPLGEALADHIYAQLNPSSVKSENKKIVYKRMKYNAIAPEDSSDNTCSSNCKYIMYKGFEPISGTDINNTGIYTQHPRYQCNTCPKRTRDISSEFMQPISVVSSKEDLENSLHSCQLLNTNVHREIAQLLLWREDNPKVEGTLQKKTLFRVALVGSSGPATYGLASILVDTEQTHDLISDFKETKEVRTSDNLLCKLQLSIRKSFMTLYLSKLEENLNSLFIADTEGNPLPASKKNTYINLVKTAISPYLNTVLYKYFLPFLHERDMWKIYNGTKVFLSAMTENRISPFVLNYNSVHTSEFPIIADKSIKEVMARITDVLSDTLKHFKGFEAFYLVTVKNQASEKTSLSSFQTDTRSAVEIKMLDPTTDFDRQMASARSISSAFQEINMFFS